MSAHIVTDLDRAARLAGVPAWDRYSLRSLPVPGGDLTFGVWEPAQESSLVTTVLALHGITGNHRCWPYLVERLPGARIIAPDLRGRGGSSEIEGPFGLSHHADDMVAVLDSVGVESAVVVGHSMGGYVGLVLADRHPDRVRSLVLVDGGLPLGGGVTDPEAEADRIIASLANRLAMIFPSRASAVRFWRHHPAFEGAWTSVVEDYARYDLGGQAPRLRSRASYASLIADSRDVHQGESLRRALSLLGRPDVEYPAQWLVASHGLMNDIPALYPPPVVVHWHETFPQLAIRPVNAVNHYTIVMSRRGAEAIASAVRRVGRG
ncbi:MAG: alpha/beta fold hydrolase [Microlunatus sp.]|nr:alpha/beta fold hydrolase [Microlunatus sp.]